MSSTTIAQSFSHYFSAASSVPYQKIVKTIFIMKSFLSGHNGMVSDVSRALLLTQADEI